MTTAIGIVGLTIIIVSLLDIFKAIVLARRARGDFRLTNAFYSATWPVFVAIGRRTESGRRREAIFGYLRAIVAAALVLALGGQLDSRIRPGALFVFGMGRRFAALLKRLI